MPLCEGLWSVFLDNKDGALNDANIHKRRWAPASALHAAINAGNRDAVALFLPFWTDPVGTRRWPDDDPAEPIPVKSRPLGLACEAGQWEVFAHILDHSSTEEINRCDTVGQDKGKSIGHRLLEKMEAYGENPDVKAGCLNALAALARRPDWDADAPATQKEIESGSGKHSVMQAAIKDGNIQIVRLLAPKVDIDALRWIEAEPMKKYGKNEVEKHTLLSFAIFRGEKAIVEAFFPHAQSLAKNNIEWLGGAHSPLEIARNVFALDIAVMLAKELLNRGLMPKEEQRELEKHLSHQHGSLSKDALDYKEQFAAAREAAEIRAVVDAARPTTSGAQPASENTHPKASKRL